MRSEPCFVMMAIDSAALRPGPVEPGCYLGIDLGGTNVKSGLVLPDGDKPWLEGRTIQRQLVCSSDHVLHLVEAGLLNVRRGDGTYVAERPPGFSATERNAMLREGALRFAATAQTVNATLPDASTALASAWKTFQPVRSGEKS